ncbi:MAG: DUF2442 domain-containing protein [Pseudanabaena sp.]
MNPYIKKVKPLENYCLMLWFENGEQKIFDLKPYLNKGVFNQLKNNSLFASVRVVAGSVEWAYDTLYLEGISTSLVEELRNKIDIAAAECDRGEGINGETAINQLRARLHRSNTL